jgi:hypothetical protein
MLHYRKRRQIYDGNRFAGLVCDERVACIAVAAPLAAGDSRCCGAAKNEIAASDHDC